MNTTYSYLDTVLLIERLHANFLEIVKMELDFIKVHDINNVQSIILFNIGDSEMSIGELSLRGCYNGTNVSYNIKKLVENQYLSYNNAPHDRRSKRVRLTRKGSDLRERLNTRYTRHANILGENRFGPDDFQMAVAAMQRLDRAWTRVRDSSLMSHA